MRSLWTKSAWQQMFALQIGSDSVLTGLIANPRIKQSILASYNQEVTIRYSIKWKRLDFWTATPIQDALNYNVFIALIMTYRYCEILFIALVLRAMVKDTFSCLLGCVLLPLRWYFVENKYENMPISIILSCGFQSRL